MLAFTSPCPPLTPEKHRERKNREGRMPKAGEVENGFLRNLLIILEKHRDFL
jgi:hypothetical protein